MYVGCCYDDVALFSVILKRCHDYGDIAQFLHIFKDVFARFLFEGQPST